MITTTTTSRHPTIAGRRLDSYDSHTIIAVSTVQKALKLTSRDLTELLAKEMRITGLGLAEVCGKLLHELRYGHR